MITKKYLSSLFVLSSFFMMTSCNNNEPTKSEIKTALLHQILLPKIKQALPTEEAQKEELNATDNIMKISDLSCDKFEFKHPEKIPEKIRDNSWVCVTKGKFILGPWGSFPIGMRINVIRLEDKSLKIIAVADMDGNITDTYQQQ